MHETNDLGRGEKWEASKITVVMKRVDTDPPFTVSANNRDKKKTLTEGGGAEFKANIMSWFLQKRQYIYETPCQRMFGCESLNGSKRISDILMEEKFMDWCKIYGNAGNSGAQIAGDWESI